MIGQSTDVGEESRMMSGGGEERPWGGRTENSLCFDSYSRFKPPFLNGAELPSA